MSAASASAIRVLPRAATDWMKVGLSSPRSVNSIPRHLFSLETTSPPPSFERGPLLFQAERDQASIEPGPGESQQASGPAFVPPRLGEGPLDQLGFDFRHQLLQIDRRGAARRPLGRVGRQKNLPRQI